MIRSKYVAQKLMTGKARGIDISHCNINFPSEPHKPPNATVPIPTEWACAMAGRPDERGTLALIFIPRESPIIIPGADLTMGVRP